MTHYGSTYRMCNRSSMRITRVKRGVSPRVRVGQGESNLWERQECKPSVFGASVHPQKWTWGVS